MLRSGQHSEKAARPWIPWCDGDIRVPVLVEMIDSLDLETFFRDPAYRRQLNEVLETFSDDEFDRFELLYTRRFTLN